MSKDPPQGKTEDEEEDLDAPEDDKPMGFWEHLEELRKRVVRGLLALIVGTSVAWYYKGRLLKLLFKPYHDQWIELGIPGEPHLNFSSPGDSFTAYFTLSLIGGLALAAPVIFYQLWAFIAPGLYAREKRYVIPFVGASSILFVGGGYFGYLAAFPITYGYFLSLAGSQDGVTVLPTIMMEQYIDSATKMLLGFGLVFQIPILFSFLALVGVLNHKKMLRWARYYIFGACFLSAVLTPPDMTSMLAMAIPAIGLYFLSIGLVFVFQRKDSLLAEIELQKEKEREEKEKADKEREEKERREKLERERRKRLAAKPK